MVICCFFLSAYSNPLFPRILSTSGGWVTSMRDFCRVISARGRAQNAENGTASRRQAGWSIPCPHGRFFQMVGERSQTGAKKYFEGLSEIAGSPFPSYMNVTLSASHSVTFLNSASKQNWLKSKKLVAKSNDFATNHWSG